MGLGLLGLAGQSTCHLHVASLSNMHKICMDFSELVLGPVTTLMYVQLCTRVKTKTSSTAILSILILSEWVMLCKCCVCIHVMQ